MTDPQFLLDTNICIFVIEGIKVPLRHRIEDLSPGAIVTSAVAYAEVMRGVDMSDAAARANANAFFDVCAVLSFDRSAALAFCDVPFKRGKFDHLIAAHCLSLNLTLVTADEHDFVGIPGLRIENWTR